MSETDTDDGDEQGRIKAGTPGDGSFMVEDKQGRTVRFDDDEGAKTAAMMLLNQISGGDVTLEAFSAGDERGREYGDPTPNMEATARIWDAFIKNRLYEVGIRIDETIVRPEDVPQMMIGLKMARFQTGEPDRDHFVDEAGYARVTADVLGVNDGD